MSVLSENILSEFVKNAPSGKYTLPPTVDTTALCNTLNDRGVSYTVKHLSGGSLKISTGDASFYAGPITRHPSLAHR